MKASMLESIRHRRSCRAFSTQKVEEDKISDIVKAALWSPTSKNNRPWEFIIVQSPETIKSLATCKPHGASFMAHAALAIVVIGDPKKSDVWVEDCSIAAINMQMTAEELGLGSTWVQVRLRMHNETISASQYVKSILQIPHDLEVAAIIAFGYKNKDREPYSDDVLNLNKIHYERY